MKLLAYLTGLALMISVAGCEWHHHHDDYRGGAYNGNYQGNGYGTYTYPPPAYPRDDDHWEHRDYRY